MLNGMECSLKLAKISPSSKICLLAFLFLAEIPSVRSAQFMNADSAVHSKPNGVNTSPVTIIPACTTTSTTTSTTAAGTNASKGKKVSLKVLSYHMLGYIALKFTDSCLYAYFIHENGFLLFAF